MVQRKETGESEVIAMAQDDHMELASSKMKQHPMDPHEPNFSELLPLPLRPYPSFEGWFIRILDPSTKFSAAVILATNYATGESQVTILFALADDDEHDESIKCGYTYAVAVKTKVNQISLLDSNLPRNACFSSFVVTRKMIKIILKPCRLLLAFRFVVNNGINPKASFCYGENVFNSMPFQWMVHGE